MSSDKSGYPNCDGLTIIDNPDEPITITRAEYANHLEWLEALGIWRQRAEQVEEENEWLKKRNKWLNEQLEAKGLKRERR